MKEFKCWDADAEDESKALVIEAETRRRAAEIFVEKRFDATGDESFTVHVRTPKGNVFSYYADVEIEIDIHVGFEKLVEKAEPPTESTPEVLP